MSGKPGGVSFDRAVDYYDETRRLPDQIAGPLIDILSRELLPRGRCLEIGVGTGRFALPLSDKGVNITGIDLSVPMMKKLISKAAESSRVLLARADATRLPFRDASFGAGLACHVLHLIPNWQGALDELVRVTGPGALLLIDMGLSSPEQLSLEEFLRSEFGPLRPGLETVEELDAYLVSKGARVRTLEPVEQERHAVPEEFLRNVDEDKFSFTWGLGDEEKKRVKEGVRRWATERYGDDLTVPRTRITRIVWRAYDL